MKLRVAILVLAASGFILLASLIACDFFGLSPPGRKEFHQHLVKLRIGMHQQEVQALLGKVPTYACRLSQSDIWYYAAPGRLTGRWPTNTPKIGTLFNAPSELPDVYANIQMAFDAHHRLSAYTYIGESYTIMTSNGPVKGSHFKSLPPEFFR